MFNWNIGKPIETPCKMACYQAQGRSARGDRVYRKVGQKGLSVTVCCAVSPDGGLLHYQAIQGGMKKELFANFLQVLCGNLILNEGPDTDGVYILDNAPGHARIEEMDFNGIFQLHRLPKYSPFLTMVENAISCWKVP